jgi:hypothetical protein
VKLGRGVGSCLACNPGRAYAAKSCEKGLALAVTLRFKVASAIRADFTVSCPLWVPSLAVCWQLVLRAPLARSLRLGVAGRLASGAT